MKVTFIQNRAFVTREPGDKRARSESHFWLMLRNTLNRELPPGAAPSLRWRKVRPERGGYGLTSMPYALWRDGSARDRRAPALLGDQNYMLACPAKAYNAGRQVPLTLY